MNAFITAEEHAAIQKELHEVTAHLRELCEQDDPPFDYIDETFVYARDLKDVLDTAEKLTAPDAERDRRREIDREMALLHARIHLMREDRLPYDVDELDRMQERFKQLCLEADELTLLYGSATTTNHEGSRT